MEPGSRARRQRGGWDWSRRSRRARNRMRWDWDWDWVCWADGRKQGLCDVAWKIDRLSDDAPVGLRCRVVGWARVVGARCERLGEEVWRESERERARVHWRCVCVLDDGGSVQGTRQAIHHLSRNFGHPTSSPGTKHMRHSSNLPQIMTTTLD